MSAQSGFTLRQYAICLSGVVWREALRFLHQRERFVSALVRPLVWLFIFAAGFRSVLGVSIIPPYETYVLYEVYITPGLMAMIQLFNGMQSSLSMVYDREMGNMRTLLVSPFPRWFLLGAKLFAGVAVSILQVYAFLLIAYFWEIEPPTKWGYLTVLPALALAGLMLGALGMLLSSLIKQLENFAGVMNFVIFPMFFASSALYPLWRVKESSPWLYYVCEVNPFTHAVELIRFAFYQHVAWEALALVVAYTSVFLFAAIRAYDPAKRHDDAQGRVLTADAAEGAFSEGVIAVASPNAYITDRQWRAPRWSLDPQQSNPDKETPCPGAIKAAPATRTIIPGDSPAVRGDRVPAAMDRRRPISKNCCAAAKRVYAKSCPRASAGAARRFSCCSPCSRGCSRDSTRSGRTRSGSI